MFTEAASASYAVKWDDEIKDLAGAVVVYFKAQTRNPPCDIFHQVREHQKSMHILIDTSKIQTQSDAVHKFPVPGCRGDYILYSGTSC